MNSDIKFKLDCHVAALLAMTENVEKISSSRGGPLVRRGDPQKVKFMSFGIKIVGSFAALLSLSGCIAPLVVGSTAVVGTTAMEERGLDGAVTDQSIRARINYEWGRSPLDYSGIEIVVYNGRVLLTGPVKDAQTQGEAIRLAKFAQGVREVINATKIGGADSYFSDGWITTKLRTQLMANKHIASHNYTMRTYDATVYIFGTAQSEFEKEQVMMEAEDIKGVKRVVDLIEMKREIQTPAAPPHRNIEYPER